MNCRFILCKLPFIVVSLLLGASANSAPLQSQSQELSGIAFYGRESEAKKLFNEEHVAQLREGILLYQEFEQIMKDMGFEILIRGHYGLVIDLEAFPIYHSIVATHVLERILGHGEVYVPLSSFDDREIRFIKGIAAFAPMLADAVASGDAMIAIHPILTLRMEKSGVGATFSNAYEPTRIDGRRITSSLPPPRNLEPYMPVALLNINLREIKSGAQKETAMKAYHALADEKVDRLKVMLEERIASLSDSMSDFMWRLLESHGVTQSQMLQYHALPDAMQRYVASRPDIYRSWTAHLSEEERSDLIQYGLLQTASMYVAFSIEPRTDERIARHGHLLNGFTFPLRLVNP